MNQLTYVETSILSFYFDIRPDPSKLPHIRLTPKTTPKIPR